MGVVNDYPTGPVPYDERPRRHTGIPGMSTPERDEWITHLRRRGWSYRRIAEALNMSVNGVHAAAIRIAEGRPGRDPRA